MAITENEQAAKEWLMNEYNLVGDVIIKSNGTPDFTTPVGDFEVKTLTQGAISFGRGQSEKVSNADILVFQEKQLKISLISGKVIILKCELKKQKKRLEKRKDSKNKIRENLDAEIFDVCFEEAKELRHKVEVVES